MLSPYQLRWGVDQWTAYLRELDIPIMPRSRYLLEATLASGGDTVSARELVEIVTGDPFLALRLLRTAENRRSRTLGRETTTPLASILQIGVDDISHIIEHSPLCDDHLPGLAQAEFRCATGSYLARRWSACHADISPDEVALAALLADIGEMMLWHFLPEIPTKVGEDLYSDRAIHRAQAEQRALGFTFRSLTLSLAAAWALPPLITALIRGANTVRANIARIASQTARHLQMDPENPAIANDIRFLEAMLPGVGWPTLLAPLPVADEFRAELLRLLAE